MHHLSITIKMDKDALVCGVFTLSLINYETDKKDCCIRMVGNSLDSGKHFNH